MDKGGSNSMNLISLIESVRSQLQAMIKAILIAGKCVILTHTGKRHIDEVIAVAMVKLYIRAKCGDINIDVVRVNGIAEYDRSEFDVCIYLDIGSQVTAITNPKSGGFVMVIDHHIDEECFRGECTASLVMSIFHPKWRDNKRLFNYIHRITVQDNGGPKSLSDIYGTGFNNLTPFLETERLLLESDIEMGLLTEILASAIQTKLDFVSQKVPEAMSWLKTHLVITPAAGELMTMRITDPLPPEISPAALHAAQGTLINEFKLHLVYGFSTRTPGERTLWRTNQLTSRELNFNKCTPKYKTFQKDYLVGFKPACTNEWKELVKQATNGNLV